jgi:hypothetical protein
MCLWSHHDVANRHYRRYRAGQINRLQSEVGWHVLRIGYVNACIFPVTAAVRFIQRYTKTSPADSYDMGPDFLPLNFVLGQILQLEAWLLVAMGLRLPIGVDLVSIARRDNAG